MRQQKPKAKDTESIIRELKVYCIVNRIDKNADSIIEHFKKIG